jgi:hypothetical protein
LCNFSNRNVIRRNSVSTLCSREDNAVEGRLVLVVEVEAMEEAVDGR